MLEGIATYKIRQSTLSLLTFNHFHNLLTLSCNDSGSKRLFHHLLSISGNPRTSLLTWHQSEFVVPGKYLKKERHLQKNQIQALFKTRPSKMEIYHRDHWIIIVHTASWNNLTKGTDENTAIGWISHIGKIVKRMLPVTPAFAPKARRSGLHKIYFSASEPRVPWRGAYQIHLVILGY